MNYMKGVALWLRLARIRPHGQYRAALLQGACAGTLAMSQAKPMWAVNLHPVGVVDDAEEKHKVATQSTFGTSSPTECKNHGKENLPDERATST